MDVTKLLDQFLGGEAKENLRQAGDAARHGLAGLDRFGGFAGGAAAGGLLALLLGNKKVRKSLSGLVGYGGAAALGALAYKAYQNWQQGRAAESAPVAERKDVGSVEPRFLPETMPGANGRPFQLTLVLAMIAAAKADGHIDAEEQRLLFERIGPFGLEAEAKAFVFDALAKPGDIAELAAAARTQEQAAELYLASRLAIDPDHPQEKAYLQTLAHRLALPPGLVAHLDRQVEGVAGQPAP